MVSKKLITTVLGMSLAALILGASITAPSFSSQAKVKVTYANGSDSSLIPGNLSWGPKSTAAAQVAIAFAKKEAEDELVALRDLGAIRVTKSLINTVNNSYPDFKSYVDEFKQYVLIGFNSEGIEIGRSASLPKDSTNLAAKLVVVSQEECRLTENEPSTASLPACSVALPSTSAFLRASLRTALAQGTLDDQGGDVYQRLVACLNGKSKISVKGNVLLCPKNTQIFGTKEIPLKGKFATRSYTIKVNLTNRTAQMLYSKRDYSKVAKNGTYDSWAVVNFR